MGPDQKPPCCKNIYLWISIPAKNMVISWNHAHFWCLSHGNGSKHGNYLEDQALSELKYRCQGTPKLHLLREHLKVTRRPGLQWGDTMG
jgi:hypothetical protein